MRKYNFDELVDRRNTGSIKWDVRSADELPMWVADMDFKAAPEIREALSARVAHGVFGYSEPSQAWAQAYVNWWKTRHQFDMRPEWLIFTTGVVPAISTAVRKLTTPAEKVLVQTPVYNIFFNSILNNGRVPVEVPLLYHSSDHHYSIDFEALEACLSDPQVSLMIVCNPQNPTGRIWTKGELEHIGELCKRHHVTVISDEIHCDIVRPGAHYTPFAAASETCREISVTCMAPTKCFNIAGLQTAAVCVPDEALRHKMWRGLNTDEVAEGNVFSADVAVVAFSCAGAWLDEMCAYITENIDYMRDYIEREIPQIQLIWGGATYLPWLDVSSLTSESREFTSFLRAQTGLWLSDGAQYGDAGKAFVRINAACPFARVQDGMERLKRGVRLYLENKS